MSFTEGPILIMCLSKKNAVESWKELMGPENVNEAKTKWMTTVRARFGQSSMDNPVIPTLVYGSGTQKDADKEIKFFFPNFLKMHYVDEFSINRYLQTNIYDLLFDALNKCAKLQPDEPIVWIAKWLLKNNPNKPIFESSNEVPKSISNTENSSSKFLNASQMQGSDDSTLPSSDYYDSRLYSSMSTDLSESYTLNTSFSDLIEKCLMCPSCQKMIQIIYTPKVRRSSVILGQTDADNKHAESIVSPSLGKLFHHISQTNSLKNNNCRRDSVKCGSCNEIFKINLQCFDKLATNLKLKLDCEK